jgi:hypothetical protein
MKTYGTGTLSGCMVWIIVFGMLCMCLMPIVMITGSITSTVTADSVAGILAPYLCPPETSPDIITYETTTTDENGFETPSTAFEMRCVAPNGDIIKDLGPTYAFIWIGILTAGGIILAAILAFFLAAPTGVLVTRWLNRRKKEQSETS